MVKKESIAVKHTTGIGEVVGYVCVNEPSTKYVKEGEYQINILINKDEGEALTNKIQEIQQKQYETYRKNSKKAEISALRPYVKVEKDENGRIVKETPDPEGRYVLKAKNKAYITNGAIGQKIQIFDAKLKPIENVKFGSGSKVRLGVTLEGYSTNLGTGVSVKLRMIQLIEVSNYSGFRAEDFFNEEDGYEFSEAQIEDCEDSEEEDF